MKSVSKSHEDVEKYAEFFEKNIGFHNVEKMTEKTNKAGFRDKIIKKFEEMLSHCKVKGNNPYFVNVITFSGHGITYQNEAIAVISEEIKGEDGEVKRVFLFINISYWA